MRFFEGTWYYDPSQRGFGFIPPGNYEEGVVQEPTKFISWQEAMGLVPVLEESGLLRPRLDERLRTEDLKITHRLLDIVERKGIAR